MFLAIGVCASDAMCLWGRPFARSKTLAPSCAGWRQSPESLALENQGFGFEEADFEVHFSEKGKELFQKCFLDRLLTNQSLEN